MRTNRNRFAGLFTVACGVCLAQGNHIVHASWAAPTQVHAQDQESHTQLLTPQVPGPPGRPAGYFIVNPGLRSFV